MKLTKLLCFLLALTVMLPVLAACKNEPAEDGSTESTENTSNQIAGIEKQNYGTDYIIFQPDYGTYNKFYWSDGTDSSNLAQANYEREMLIEDHLGIEIFREIFAAREGVLYAAIEQQNLGGLDDYQFLLTHPFQDIFSLVTSDLLTDISELPGVSMNDEYWNVDIMESAKVKGHLYLGNSAFILHTPTMMLFNKDMANAFSNIGADKLYEHVREKTWTIERLQEYASMVDTSMNETLSDPMLGTYGYVSETNWPLNAYPTASGYFHATIDSDGNYQLRNFNDTIFDIFKEIVEMTDSDYYYGWDWEQQDIALRMSTGRAFFSTVGVEEVIEQMLSSEVPLGVLPYPTMEEGMEYKSLDWSGFFLVPTTVTNQKLTGEVLELFSYYGKTKIETEFYDVLLGLRASQVPQDREMLELIFDNLVIEPALAFCNTGGSSLSGMFYCIPYMILGNQKAMASWYAGVYPGAADMLAQLNE